MIRLNKKEEEVMNIFWRLQKAFPKEIMVNLKPPVPPYNTVLSLVRKLEKDGFISFIKVGKSHQYFPKISKREYQKSIFSHLLKDYFGGSHEKLLSFFIKEEKMDQEELNDFLSNLSKDQ